MLLLLLIVLAVCLAAATATTNAKHLAGYGRHFLLIQESGQAYAVGNDDYGQLGIDKGTGFQSFPQHVLNIKHGTDACAGWHHTCVVDEDGKATKCGGNNVYGQIGTGSKDVYSYNVLTEVPGLASDRVDQVVCGSETSFALLSTGQVKAWGLNSHGHLGVNSNTEFIYSPRVVQTPEGKKIALVVSGAGHTCFLALDGSVSCTGGNDYGQLAPNRYPYYVIKPVDLTSILPGPISTISCGLGHTCVVTKDSNQVYCWGANFNGELGFTNPPGSEYHNTWYSSPIHVPGVVTTGTSSSSIFAIHECTFVIQKNSTAIAFGNDKYGQFGRGSTSAEPTGLVQYGNGVANILEIRGGFHTTCMLNSAGDVLCAGKNDFGQLGVGSSGDSILELTKMASAAPTKAPSRKPTVFSPTKKPTKAPTKKPTKAPTVKPTKKPTKAPTSKPTKKPTATATKYPTKAPTVKPTKKPTKAPTHKPTTKFPTKYPVKSPTSKPTTG